MINRNVIVLPVCAAMGAYAIWGLVQGTGPAGWLNQAQQSLMGSYSLKLTTLLLTVAVVALGALLAGLLGLAGLRDAPGTELGGLGQRAAAAQPPTMKAWLLTAALTGGGLAGGGYAWSAWQGAQLDQDLHATYQPLQLVDGAPAARGDAQHLALRARVEGKHVVEQRKGSGSSARVEHLFVPLVAPQWQPGQPVNYFAQVKFIGQLVPLQLPRPAGLRAPAPPPADPTLLVAVDGVLPVPAAEAFKRMGVPPAPDAVLLRVVPSRDGAPVPNDAARRDLQLMAWVLAGMGALIALTLCLVGLVQLAKARRAAAAALA